MTMMMTMMTVSFDKTDKRPQNAEITPCSEKGRHQSISVIY